MSLKQQLFEDLKESMKSKDTVRKEIIQMVRAGVLLIEKDTKTELDDRGVSAVISKEFKKLNDVLPDYIRSGRADKLDEINRKIDILKSYLPEQLTGDQIQKIVDAAVAETGAGSMKDMGRVMGIVTQKTKGLADGKAVSETVKKTLQAL
ncbi:MAG: GatB/YqeY domain-containing protein [Clostridiales bacterium]|nr:GatB/YqeY domain-containing protein [Clostridiales bacterium]